MLDDLRQASETTFEEEASPASEQDDYTPRRPRRRPTGRFLGMTPPQRFIIAVMLLMMTCMLAPFFLLVTEKIVPPFLY